MSLRLKVLSIFLHLSFAQFINFNLRADEGMWLISQIHRNIDDMQRLGFKLSAEDIYSINSNSLKDAIVMLDDGGCSAEIISPLGLVLTNHHCAISNIQQHTTKERNLLRDGFWAKTLEQEIPIEGKTALILKRVEDVSQRVTEGISINNNNFIDEVELRMMQISAGIESNEKGTYAQVVPMHNYNHFYLFVYHRFTDIRLVGAPPMSIGKFGGDIDNWRWPRHTGDFALYRIYSDSKGNPANYHRRNKPYVPKHHLPISISGIEENDFTMIIGYPGTTYRYATSYQAEHERDVVAPWTEEVWGQFIKTIKDTIQTDEELKLHFTDTHDMLVNFWQKDTYQAKSMNRFSVVERLKEREDSLRLWAKKRPDDGSHYIDAIETIEQFYKLLREKNLEEQYRSISSLIDWPVEIGDRIYAIEDLFMAMAAERGSKRKVRKEVRKLNKMIDEIFENYYPNIDMRLYSSALISLIENLPSKVNDPILNELINQEYPQLFTPMLVNFFYNNSYFTSAQNFKELLKNPVIDSLAHDALFMLHLSYENLASEIQDSIIPYQKKYMDAMRHFNRGILEMQADKIHYPDANSTMRVSYGKVTGYQPRDGVSYGYITYLKGKIQKEEPDVDVFKVSPKIKKLWQEKDFGQYADKKGMPVCFITDNDITNGNSGSPVLNAYGHLVGIAFDGNYEAMACDFMHEPTMQRTIATDIRYVLFIIDKLANVNRLIDEMTIITN